MKAWRRFVSKVREVGPLYALELTAERLVPRILFDFRAVYLCQLALPGDLTTAPGDPQVHLAEPDEFERLMRHHDVLRGIREKLGPGVKLWVLGEGDKVDAFMWLNSQVIQPSDWVRLELSEQEISGIYVWVSPERRGTGFGPRVNRHVSHECARAGYVRIVSTVDLLNRNSLRADEKVGYERIGRVFVWRVLGFGGIFCRGMARFGWWTGKHPLSLPVAEIERSLGSYRVRPSGPGPR